MFRKLNVMTARVLANVALILLAVALVGVVSGQLRTRSLNAPAIGSSPSPQPQANTSVAGDGSRHTAAEENFLDPSELRGEIKRTQDLLILDIRSREEFARGHIPSAINIPQDEIHSRALDELPGAKLLVVSSFECSNDELSKIIRDELVQLGFTRIAILRKGTSGWTQAGFEIETSAYSEPRIYTASERPPDESAQRR